MPTTTEFRDALSHMGAAVGIITTGGASGRAGMTATAICPVTDEPPTLMVCINRSSQSAPFIRSNGRLCINLLSTSEIDVAHVFAGRTGVRMDGRFDIGDWLTLPSGAPMLATALVAMDCRVVETKAVASHDVHFVEVESINIGKVAEPLLYYRRDYRTVGADTLVA